MGQYFDLKVGFSCNNNCIHCVITDKKGTKDVKTEELKNIINQVPKGDIVGFTGGEATIRKDFVDLLKYAKETGHKTALQTNGSMLYKEEFAQDVAKYLDSALIAIHSHIPEIHNTIVDCPASQSMHSRTIQGFKNLIKYGVPTSTQTVISKLNIGKLVETYDFIQNIAPGITMNLTYPHPNGAAYKNANVVVPKYSEIKNDIQKILKKHAKHIQVEAIPTCYLYPYQDEVSHNYDEEILRAETTIRGMDPANKNDGQFFDENGINENYNDSIMSEKLKGYKCKECIFDSRCAGVWKEYIEFYGKELDLYPIKEANKEENTKTDAESRTLNNINSIVDAIGLAIQSVENNEDGTEINNKIVRIIKDSYFLVREDPSTVSALYEAHDLFAQYFFMRNEQIPSYIWNRVTSIISFKNDILLQSCLTKENVDRYFQETKFLFDKKHYIDGNNTIFKIMGMFAKIQYAYNLIGSDIILRDYYNEMMSEVGKDFDKHFQYYKDLEINVEFYNMPVFLMYYILFYTGNNNAFPQEINKLYEHILLYWKGFKIYHYDIKGEELESELKPYKYDLIYLEK